MLIIVFIQVMCSLPSEINIYFICTNLTNQSQNYIQSFIMDWPDRKQNNQKQPPDKKNKPKYVAKEQAQGQQPIKAEPKVAAPKNDKKYERNNEGFNNNRKYQQRQKYEQLQRPKFIEKVSSSTEHSLTCMICSEHIRRKQPIWTCQSCYISLHLKCIKQWIKKTNQSKNQVEKKFLISWTCIQCKNQYNETMPEYYCFCGKFKNPDNDRDLEPHSCGKPCQRKRGKFCPHLCPDVCHSGMCRPCQHEGALVKCNCGKTQRMARCSQDRAIFQCGKRCEKILSCGKHKCQRNCHNGDCYPCKKKHLVSCYCGKNEDVVDCIQNFFACEQVCQKLLECGYHKCQRDCHEGPCGPCKKTPQLQKTCHCGRYQLMMITQAERETCKDPIASCGMPCKKKLPCDHQCPLICHQGRCGDCKVLVQQQCRCGTTQRKIQCWKTKHAKQQFHCDNICKKKRSCGIHVCNTQCCKYKNYVGPEAHQCELTCQKTLNCEKHTCDMPCHAGLCKKCPVIYSQAQPCPCGATSLRPPIICGTITPQCDNFCNKEMPCGHKCSNLCHYGPCKCREEVNVTCRCGRSKILTVCGREALCLNKCQQLLQCGHKCLVQCHAGSCVQANKDGCFKKCEKDRADCGHKCKQICHIGKKCQQFPCEAQILIKCQCGHRQTSILCGSQGRSQPTQKKKQIVCNSKCENMKRFDILYKGKQIYYPNALMQFGFKNFNYLQRIQDKLERFISQSDSHFIEIQFKQIGDNACKTAMHNLFENHYHLNTHFYRHMKTASFTLTQTEHTMIPKPCLSEYIKQVAKGYIKRTNLPFEYTIKFDGQAREKVEVILKSLKHYIHKYYVQRKQKMVYIHFWNKNDGIEAKAQLESDNQTVHFYGQENIAKIEQLQEPIDMNQIIETQLKQGQASIKPENNQQQLPNKPDFQQQKKENEAVENKNKNYQATKQSPQITQTKKDQKKQEAVEKKEGEEKPKIIMKPAKQSPKLIIRPGGFNFIRSQYPPSSENVQDIYAVDDDQLYGDEVDWDKVVKDMIEKKMGIQASEWRIRSLIMISLFHEVQDKVLRDELVRIIDMYDKDKEKAKRILQIQRLQLKRIQQQMKGNQIYLSDHEPEIMSYTILYNYFAKDKIELSISDECAETMEVQQSLQIIRNVQQSNWEQFYTQFKNSGYLLACMLVPFVHEIRQNFLKVIGKKKQRVPVQNLWRNLLFESEDDLIEFCKQNGISIVRRVSKSKKIEEYCLGEGELLPQMKKDERFVDKISEKRDKSYFLQEAKELVDDKWMTRSFFAFGDFKQSISSKYMLNLCKKLREN